MRRRQRVTLVGVDTGGTFTDVVAAGRPQIRRCKVRSTPRDPRVAVLRGSRVWWDPRATLLHYGSTVATNALLERRGAPVALVTTAGFEDVIENRSARRVLASYDLDAAHRLGAGRAATPDRRHGAS
jgi:N-methylhydantoinase A/oxoprolinase/acetone carboxylase beta subunit